VLPAVGEEPVRRQVGEALLVAEPAGHGRLVPGVRAAVTQGLVHAGDGGEHVGGVVGPAPAHPRVRGGGRWHLWFRGRPGQGRVRGDQ